MDFKIFLGKLQNLADVPILVPILALRNQAILLEPVSAKA